MFIITFGHAVRPFDNITRRWLSLHDISSEPLHVKRSIQREVHIAKQDLHKIVTIFQIHDVIKHINHMPTFNYEKTAGVTA